MGAGGKISFDNVFYNKKRCDNWMLLSDITVVELRLFKYQLMKMKEIL